MRGMTPIPWDQKAFGVPVFEIEEPSAEALARASANPGHYTVKVDPLAPLDVRRRIHEAGFFYTDTLIEPWCAAAAFAPQPHPDVSARRGPPLEPLLEMTAGAYAHGRFHRDFTIPAEKADLRYHNWLRELHAAGGAIGLHVRDELAAYFATSGNKACLHAVAPAYRGKGLGKHLWSAAYALLFSEGHAEVRSSISAGNLAILNLYASLGFRFRNARDVYHLHRPSPTA